MSCSKVGIVLRGADFAAMTQKNAIVLERILRFTDCGDLHPRPYPRFPWCQSAFFDGNDKNFAFYWLFPHKFPALRDVYLNSHPCDWNIHLRFPKSVQWHITKP